MLYITFQMAEELLQRLEEFRLENRISQQKLAEILGVSYVSVNRWLNGHAKPSKIQEYHIQKLLSTRDGQR
jgi:transcriptional regulator with XRE-family HTH domain